VSLLKSPFGRNSEAYSIGKKYIAMISSLLGVVIGFFEEGTVIAIFTK
jgi:hypothetical protein